MKQWLIALTSIVGFFAAFVMAPVIGQTFISGYQAAGPLQGNELILGDQGGVTVTMTPNQLKTFIGNAGSGTITGSQVISALGFTPANSAGQVFSGEVSTPASTAGTSGLNIGQGTAPTSPANGDLWATSGGLFARIAGATIGPFTSNVQNLTAVAHFWVNSFTNGTPGTSQPACGDLSNSAPSCSNDTTNASNISSGTLNNGRLSAQVPLTNQPNVFGTGGTGSQSNPHVTLTFAATVTPNFASGNNFKMTFGAGNVTTMAYPTNVTDGICGTLKLVQDGVGSRTIGSWGAGWKFPGGTPPVLSTGANAQDIVSFCSDGTAEVDAAVQKTFQ